MSDPEFEPYEDAVDAAWFGMRSSAARYAKKHGSKLPKGTERRRRGRGLDPDAAVDKELEREAENSEFSSKAQELTQKKRYNIPTRSTGLDGRARRRVDFLPSSLGDVLKKEIRTRGWRTELSAATIISQWAELVGPAVAQHTTVEAYKEKTLYITCDTTAWATTLRTNQRSILQKIASVVGPDIVASLHITGPKAPGWHSGPRRIPGRGPRDTW
ncbi:MAG: DciA family protein [Corynebacterium sp.]|nr:DciA family protein [Corynebacterium sp.]